MLPRAPGCHGGSVPSWRAAVASLLAAEVRRSPLTSCLSLPSGREHASWSQDQESTDEGAAVTGAGQAEAGMALAFPMVSGGDFFVYLLLTGGKGD